MDSSSGLWQAELRQRRRCAPHLEGLSQGWKAVMDESLIKDRNEILKADRGTIWGDSQNLSGDWVSYLLQLSFV